ncbi:hypothetical protein CHS0354_040140 [Potamilus streckersoni]|uniref:Sushi domain-containing protein n=1 Tax=Potamilus streckersoni TaxID=2493646 RepID=A0AAE0STD1_9BIVA|nr:hypothetical protein CHS0354_040140 [Potamilus streckersoni]
MKKEMLLILPLYVLQFVDMVTGDCDTAPAVREAFHNGSITGPYSEGVVLRYMCKQAYDLIPGGSIYYKCSNGIWTGGNISCSLGRCTDIESPQNSYIVGQAGYYVGETTTFSCLEGYEMNGNGLIMCMSDRTWSPEPPTCVKVRCPEFSTPDAQIFQEFTGVQNEFGSKNKITCESGTFLQGPQYITCLANKTWSGSPSCTIPNCGNPPASYEPCTDVFYTDGHTNFGSQVEVICHENATSIGTSQFLICSVTGTWSNEYHCLCSCIGDCGGSVYTGPRNVKHDTQIDCPCPDGSHFKRKCSNGSLTNVSSCPVTYSTTTLQVQSPTTTLHVTHPKTTLHVTHPKTTLLVPHPTTLLVTHPTTTLLVTHPKTTLLVIHPTMPPAYPHYVLIAVVVSCVVVFTIIALFFFYFRSCKNRRAQLRIRCKVCCQDKISNTSITPEKKETTLISLDYQ